MLKLVRTQAMHYLVATLFAISFSFQPLRAQSKRADYMPPIAPQLDIGHSQPQAAPKLPPVQQAITSEEFPPVAPAFHSPFVTEHGGRPMLHAAATENGLYNQPFHNPLMPPTRSYFGYADEVQAPQFNGHARVPSSAGFTANASAGTGGAAMRTAARVGMGAAFSMLGRGGAGSVVGGLHCPLCRLVGGF